jgi:peptidoglycan/xylan/chitin deacetylase (PgdA/CDA1 family)
MSSPKETVKRALAAGVDRLPRHAEARAVILCYHSIHPSLTFASATPDQFSEHLAWLGEHADVVPLAEIRSPQAAGRPRVAITFDDGYEDNFTHAFPLLQEARMPATFFVTAGLVAGDEAVVRRFAETLRRCSRDELRPLTWTQLREMLTAGAEIGSHTYSHPNLARLLPGEILPELRRSKELLEDTLGVPMRAFAYPFGKPRRHVTPAAVEAAATAGYEQAVVLVTRAVRTADSDLRLPRIAVTRDDVETLWQKVTGAWDFLGWWQERAPLWAIGLSRPGDASF